MAKVSINFDPPTANQLIFARGIANVLGIDPPQETAKDVSDFIDKHQLNANPEIERLLTEYLKTLF